MWHNSWKVPGACRTVDDMLAVRVEVELRRAELHTSCCCAAAAAVGKLANQVCACWVACRITAAAGNIDQLSCGRCLA
jgi:hypothetical protein